MKIITTILPVVMYVSNWLTKTVSIVCFVFLLIFSGAECYGQGTIQITFEGPPAASNARPTVTEYSESGMLFRPIPSSTSFQRWPVGNLFGPDNGTSYVQPGRGSALEFSFTNGTSLNLVTVDLAEDGTSVTPRPATVSFIGYRFDGTTVTTNFITDGIIDQTGPLADFQTFHFDSSFSDLIRVEIPNTAWSLDNLVVVNIPEPSSLALLGWGGLLLAARRFGVRTR